MMTRFLITILMLCLTLQSKAVVQGTEIEDKTLNPQPIMPYVALSFEIKGLANDPCSGSYLGNGKILTASHCFLLNEYENTDPNICIEDYLKTKKLCVHKNDYDVYFPPLVEAGYKAPTRKTHGVLRIPKPDIAIIVLKESVRAQLPPFSVINIVSGVNSAIDYSLQKLKLVGQGCTDYIVPPGEFPKGQGVFRMADIELSPLDSVLEYNSIWTDIKSNGGICWGDSGGSLLLVQQTPFLVTQIAVVSAMKSKHNPATGEVNIVTSMYTRLDHPVVQAWLKNSILVLP